MKYITAISTLSLALLTINIPLQAMQPESEPRDFQPQNTFSWLNKHHKVEVTAPLETEQRKVGEFTFISYNVGTINGPYTLEDNPNHYSQAREEIKEDKERIQAIIQDIIETFTNNLAQPPIVALQEWPNQHYELLRQRVTNVFINSTASHNLGIIQHLIPGTKFCNILIFRRSHFNRVAESNDWHLSTLARLQTESGKSQHKSVLTVDFTLGGNPSITFTVLNVYLQWKSDFHEMFNVWLKPFFERHKGENIVIMGNFNVDFKGKYDEASSSPVKVKFSHDGTLYDTFQARRTQQIIPQTTDAIFYLLSKPSSRGNFKDWNFPITFPESQALKAADYNYEEVPPEEITQEDFLKYLMDSDISKQYREFLGILSQHDRSATVIKKHLIELGLLPVDQQRERISHLLNEGAINLITPLPDQSLQGKLMEAWQARKISIQYLQDARNRVYFEREKMEKELDAFLNKN
jgi:hypothetical protein